MWPCSLFFLYLEGQLCTQLWTSADCASIPVKGIMLLSSSTIKTHWWTVSPLILLLWKDKYNRGLEIKSRVIGRLHSWPHRPGSKEKPYYRPILLINNFYFCSQYVPLKIPKCLELLILLGPEVTALYRNTQPWLVAPSWGASSKASGRENWHSRLVPRWETQKQRISKT